MQWAEIQQQYPFNKPLCTPVKKENAATWEKLFLSESRGCVWGDGHRNSPRYLAHSTHAPQSV